MTVDRLAHLEQIITQLEEQLAGVERALITAPSEEKVRLRQRCTNLQEEIKTYQQQKEDLLANSKRSSTLKSDLNLQPEKPDLCQELLDWLLQGRSKACEEERKALKKIFFVRSIAVISIGYILIPTIDTLIDPNQQSLEFSTFSPIILVGGFVYGSISQQQKQTKLSEKLDKLESLKELKAVYVSVSSQDKQALQPIILDLAEKSFT